MMDYTVEVVLKPVVNDDWSALRRATDQIPGTLLLEDPEEPMLVVPIEAETQSTAAIFVHGVMSVLNLEVVWGRAYRAEPLGEPHQPATAPSLRPTWLEDEEVTVERLEHLLDA